jgi:hypothetical protein
MNTKSLAEKLQKVEAMIKDAQDIIVISHRNPDGDTIGSNIALAEIIRTHFGKRVSSACIDLLPSSLRFLPGSAGFRTDFGLEYADLIGLAFQIKDDILDIEGDFEKLGKKIGSDQILEKSTYVSLLGLEQSKKILNEKIKKANEIIKKEFGEKGKYLIKLADFIREREK